MEKAKFREFEQGFFEKLLKERPDYVHALTALAEIYTSKKMYREGLEIDLRLSRLCPKDAIVHYNLACSYALVSDKESALKYLEKAIKLGYRDFGHIKKDSDLKCLSGDPVFEALVSKQTK